MCAHGCLDSVAVVPKRSPIGWPLGPWGVEMSEPVQFRGNWSQAERARLQVALDLLAPHERPEYRTSLRGPWVAMVSPRPAGQTYYVLHRVGMGRAITGTSVTELIAGLLTSGIYRPPFAEGTAPGEGS